MKKIGIIIFARTSSKRFPKKVTSLINRKKTLLEIIYDRVKKKSGKNVVIINTSTNKKDDKIISICKKRGIKFYRGDLENVLSRTVRCCRKFKLDAFVRVNADRPFFDFDLMSEMINFYKKNNFDIITNQLLKTCPKGLACEIAKTQIFYKISKISLTQDHKEHIFNYFYKHKKNYKIKNYEKKIYKKNKKLNLSIDSKKDFKFAENIYKKFDDNFLIETNKVLKKTN